MVRYLAMRYRHPLDDVFKNSSHVRVLRVLFSFPPAPVGAREVARRAGISHPTASAVLDALVDTGLVTLSGSGRDTRFVLNEGSALAEQLRPLFGWEATALDQLIEFLQPRLQAMPGVTDAFIFGSVARAAETSRSDLDLAVVCDAASERRVEEDIFDVAAAVRRRFGSHVNPIVRAGPLERLCRGRSPGHRLWRKIREEGVPVFGGDRVRMHA